MKQEEYPKTLLKELATDDSYIKRKEVVVDEV